MKTRAFTLIELLVVLGIVALLLTIATPRLFPSLDVARERVLADNLRNTRIVIDQFYADTGRYPQSLDELVERRYLRSLPYDPLTLSTSSWIITPPDDPDLGAVYGIRSGAAGKGRDGVPFSEW